MTKQVTIGSVTIGGNSPIAVQSMLNRPYSDIDGNIEQSVQLQAAGCDINRVAIPNQQAIQLIPLIKNVTTMPLVADIHFDHMLAIKSIEAGIDKIRYNPGNIGSLDKAKQVIDAAKANNVPIRVGVNSGSLDKTLLKKYGGVTGQGIYESAIGHVKLIENAGYDRIVISMKASGLKAMTKA
ncbi:MAG: flavodoxin-dependent (E)-4-hydroxy-3-methylbut-2-enyl-diphosphate synthase, partial [Oscillospiraceae bacterium]|nr:flavodoxin-dependent (E)-4-hydroxy-3-methylbut-2-enyl-diphosphate synthase [Oscillospiraceae bacterium]